MTPIFAPSGLEVINSRLNIPLTDSAGAMTLILAGNVIEWRHELDPQFGAESVFVARWENQL